MAKRPIPRRVPAARTPTAPEPANQSRAAGAPAPASAAATAPGAGAHHGFYNPGDADDLGAAQPQADASGLAAFAARTQADSVQLHSESADREVIEVAAAEAIVDPTDLAAEIARIREFRKPLGAYSQKLALPTRRGYHRHWFNDVAGRVDEAKNNGWKHVTGNDGKPISRCVGSGRDKGAMFAYAMEIPEVFWQEDQDARHAEAASRVDALKAAPFRAAPGTAKASDKGKFYDPTETEAGPLQVHKG